MKLKLFIDRPILACVVSVLILLVGLIGLVNLPMEQYPDIATPTVSVSATYTGANAETVQKSVVIPLEEAINGVEDMLYMTSTSTNTGSGSIMVYFKQGTDPDMATINTKNRVSEAEGQRGRGTATRRSHQDWRDGGEAAELHAEDYRVV